MPSHRAPRRPFASAILLLLSGACSPAGGPGPVGPDATADAATPDAAGAADAPTDAPAPDASDASVTSAADARAEAAAPEAAMCGGDCGPHGHAHGDQCHCDEGFVERDRCCVPAPPCTGPDDLLEENDGPAEATAVESAGSSWEGLRVCPADNDVFRVPLVMGQRVTVRATFTHARGDIDAYLFAPGTDDLGHARPLAGSDGKRDNERFTYTARATGDHLLLVRGFNGSENTYGLVVEIAGP